jgi:long-subunit acyl-CoA synthetase (AMP-forming)
MLCITVFGMTEILMGTMMSPFEVGAKWSCGRAVGNTSIKVSEKSKYEQHSCPNVFDIALMYDADTDRSDVRVPLRVTVELSAACALKVVDIDTRQILGPEQNGEILFKSPMIMTAYWRNPQATSGSFEEDGWFKTGEAADSSPAFRTA